MICSLMSPFISTFSAAAHTNSSSFLALPGLSSPLLVPKGQMKLPTTAVLFILLSVVLLASSCEARGLRVHAKRSSSKSHPPAAKDAVCLKVDGRLTRLQADARTMMIGTASYEEHHSTHPDSKMEGVTTKPSPADAVREATAVVVEVPQQLLQREDAGFHLDYDGPRTHPPSHN